ncbi:hypothetical protein [Pyruvatibacter mobilis]|uniref:hypothetical protein n=1 Tax=Pyruvatibacter mobilis TaxID=1712261 RepID=UPI003C7E7D33
MAGAIEVDAFEDRADLVVGFAHSRTDIDGSGSLFSRQNDNALSAELNVVVIKPDPGDTGQLSWTNTYQRIGSNFFSFANPFLTNDLEEVSTGLEYAGRSLTLRGEVARQENNVTGNAALPTDRAVLTRINGAYFPFATSEAPDWLGQLTVSFGAESGWTDRIRNTDTSVDVDARSTQIYLGLSAATQSLAWGVTGAVSDFEDNGNASADQRTWSSLGFVNWVPADWFNADASVQWQHGRTQTGRSDDITVDLSATAWVIEDTLSTSAGYAGAFSSERDGYEGWENYLELNWVPRKGHSLAVRAGAAGGDSIRELSRDDRPELFGRVVYRVSTDFSR